MSLFGRGPIERGVHLPRWCTSTGLRDWATVAPSPGTTTPDPPAGGTDMFGEGSTEQAPGGWTLVGREPSNKFDFLAACARRQDLYLAFRRESPNGNTYLTFELNQGTRRWGQRRRRGDAPRRSPSASAR